MPTVFLSYRRSDTGGEAGRLADTLQHKLGQRFVFRDVVGISPGDQFDTGPRIAAGHRKDRFGVDWPCVVGGA